MLLLLSRYISLKPGPINGSQQYSNAHWAVFKKKCPHFVHINITILLPKIDELQDIARLSEAEVISVSELKLDDSVLSSEMKLKIMI